jgi:hypothetical protein
MGAKEDELSTGRVWAAGFHHVSAHSHLAGVLILTNRLFLQYFNFLRAAVNRGYRISGYGSMPVLVHATSVYPCACV